MARTLTTRPGATTGEGNGQVPPPPKRTLSSRMRGTLALAVVFGVLAGLFTLLALSDNKGNPVAVAARDLRAGETLDPGALRYVDANASADLLNALLRPADVANLKGNVLTHPVSAGSPITRDDLEPAVAPAQQRAMSVPVPPERAAGGDVAKGDRVDVIDAGGNGVEPSYVLTDAEVLGVSLRGDGRLGSSQDTYITVAVPDGAAALRLASAIERNKIQVLRATGASPLPAAVTATPTTAVGARR